MYTDEYIICKHINKIVTLATYMQFFLVRHHKRVDHPWVSWVCGLFLACASCGYIYNTSLVCHHTNTVIENQFFWILFEANMKRSKLSSAQFRKTSEERLRTTTTPKEFMKSFIQGKCLLFNSECQNITINKLSLIHI